MSDNVRATLRPFCEGKATEALVFEHPSKPGEPICGSNLYRRFVSAAARAGLPHISFHDLRHSFGTQAIRAFNISEVQRMGAKRAQAMLDAADAGRVLGEFETAAPRLRSPPLLDGLVP
jgi:integrase